MAKSTFCYEKFKYAGSWRHYCFCPYNYHLDSAIRILLTWFYCISVVICISICICQLMILCTLWSRWNKHLTLRLFHMYIINYTLMLLVIISTVLKLILIMHYTHFIYITELWWVHTDMWVKFILTYVIIDSVASS